MKMSRTLIVHALIFYLIFNNCFSQTTEIDSLQNLLKTADDTTQVNLLRWLGIYSRSEDREKALEYGLESLEKSKQIGFVKGEIEALYALGVTHGMTDNYAESLDYLNKCLDLATKQKDYSNVCSVYNAMGIVHKRIGDYPASQGYYLKSIRLVDSLQLEENVSSEYVNLGILYDLMGEQDKAVESYEKALEVYKGPNRLATENTVLSNLAVMDFNNGNYQAALDKFLQRQQYAEEQNDNVSQCIGHSNIGMCHLKLQQWKSAEEHLLKSLELAEQLSLKHQIVENYNGLADLMLQQEKFKKAIYYSNKSLEILDISGGYEQKREVHQKAYEIYEAVNQLPKAVYHLKQAMTYKDSLMNETKVREIQNLQIQHDVYVKDREIEANQLQLALLNTRVEQNKKRMVYFIIILILLLFSASLLYFRFLAKKRSNALLFEKNQLISQQKDVISDMNRQLEKRMLRAQMNPHFIFNSLSSIQHLISSDDKKGALTYLSKFSKLLRQVLESSVNITLVLKEEIELLKIYVELEALRFDHSFSYSFDIDKNLDLDKYEIPMLLVQPYIENAIIHGLMPKTGDKKLTVSFKDIDNYIECIIEDNGVGITKPKKKEVKNISRGMSITGKRINALKKFCDQELVKVEDLNTDGFSGTKVTILIPKG